MPRMMTSQIACLFLLLAGCNQPVGEGGGTSGTSAGTSGASGTGGSAGSSGSGSGGSSSSGGGLCGGTSCASGLTCCGSTCRDLTTDSSDCGRCGNVCPAGDICQGGACEPSPCQSGKTCPAGSACCGGQCCGATDQVCCQSDIGPAGYVCLGVDAGCPAPCTGPQCPVSSRRYKKDIAYLTPAEEDRMRGELLRLPLATFRYKSEGEEARARLGFMVEDATSPACVAAPGDRVDLYGYTSLAVAALQSQERELRALRAEVVELRAEVAKGQRSPAR
ncbi:MAG: tail fiber domain-containing protein [Deltaproteobacteria bacterium]